MVEQNLKGAPLLRLAKFILHHRAMLPIVKVITTADTTWFASCFLRCCLEICQYRLTK